MSWASYIYIYAIGGAVFAAGMLIAWRRGAIDLSRKWVPVLLGGMALYAGGHALLQGMGESAPFVATGDARGVEGTLGTPADLAVLIVYFVVILAGGAYFARYTRSASDFFFGGRRFAWWLVAFSCVATTVGAYSFVKYASVGFSYGLSSSMGYLNDWFWMPLWMLGWLPIVYYGRIRSVPEYFERRFGRKARVASTVILLVYLVGYIGINFLTMGKAMHALTGLPVFTASCIAAVVTAGYVSVGGQTSVIMTDLIQGFILLAVGLGLFFVGITYVGGFGAFWDGLPLTHRAGFSPLQEPSSFHAMGVFWQDAMAGGVAFYFMNQGILMRFMSARSVDHGRKAVAGVVLVVMPLAAIAVAGTGWVGRSMVSHGMLDANTAPDNVFVVVSNMLSAPGMFGLVMAALTAALMSTADTLLTAVAAVFTNDVWKPFIAGDRANDGAAELRVARMATLGTGAFAILLVPVFASFSSIFQAHAAFVAAIVPPMAVALILGAVWPRFGRRSALLVLIGGSLIVFASVFIPEMIEPFAQGAASSGEGAKAHKFMRAFFGLAVCSGLGVVGAFTFKDPAPDPGLVIGPEAALRSMFRGNSRSGDGHVFDAPVQIADVEDEGDEGDEALVYVTASGAAAFALQHGDLIYVAAPGWHGGLRSFHGRVAVDDGVGLEAKPPTEENARPLHVLRIGRATARGAGLRDGVRVKVELEG